MSATLPLNFGNRVSHFSLGFTHSARLPGQAVPGIHTYLQVPGLWEYKHMLAFSLHMASGDHALDFVITLYTANVLPAEPSPQPTNHFLFLKN